MELTITLQIPNQVMVGFEYFPEEITEEKHYWNEFSIHLLVVSITFAW